ncbi:MAG: T9SS type A sorting domain-containing protein [Bacteroidetes bacterium]|nr:T9SS type A sorting domain-containing protein [Bacteroidota bacterium]
MKPRRIIPTALSALLALSSLFALFALSSLPALFPLPAYLSFVHPATFLQSKNMVTSAKWQHPSLEPNDWTAMQRLYPYGRINPAAFLEATRQTKSMMDHAAVSNNPWVFTGPDNIGGRITDIESPAGNPSTIYIGAATGGVLKTTNQGATWTNLFSGVPVISVGDISIDPNNDQVLYCGTGEANSSSFSFLGNGIYKSTDAGASWQNMGLTHSAYIGRVVVDYSNSQRVFVAACGNLFTATDERGVYRTVDGGQSWQRVLYINDSTSAIDLVQHPTNPLILYASMWERIRGLTYRQSFGDGSGLWKSTDGGTTWNELTNGLPTGNNVGRIGIAIARSSPDILYAFYDLDNYDVGVYKSVNGGQSWTRTNDGSLFSMNSNFGWYFGQVRVDPANPDRVFVMGVDLFSTEDGGASWTDLSSWEFHVDHHAMFFDEANNRIIEGNDGGLYLSSDHGYNWDKVNNLPLTQFYAIDIDNQNPERIYGGTQDNNTIRTQTGGTSDWEPILGGDGMYTLVDYTDPNTIYAEYQWGNLYRSDDGGPTMNYIAGPMSGDRVNWSAPLVMHPTDPSVIYFGTYRVWKSIDKGDSWQPVSDDLTGGIDQYFYSITTLAISALDPSIVIAGSGDGKVHISRNDGQSWQNISAGLPNRWVTKVAADPFNAQTIYATLSGFRWDESLPHVFKSNDLGSTWVDITGNLPEFPVNDIALDPDLPGRIIVATDAGVYGTTNGGQYWYWIWDGLPAVPVYALKIHAPTRTIVAGTYGLSSYKAQLDDLMTGVSPGATPAAIHLVANPNPVETSTTLKFYLPAEDKITGTAYRMNGSSAGEIFSKTLPAGRQEISWSPRNFPAGIYLVKIEGKKFSATTKIVKY